MKSKVFLYFLLCLFLEILQISAADSAVQASSNKTTISRERSSSFIDYFTLLVNTNDQLQAKVNTLTSTKKDLEGQLVNAENKINNDTLIINAKDQEIKDQQEELKNRDDQVKDKNKQLHLQDEQIKDKSEELNEREEKVMNMTEVIQNLEQELVTRESQIKEVNEVLILRENQIKELNEHLRVKDEQINKKSAELEERNVQVSNMTEVIESLKFLVTSGEKQTKNCSDQLKKQDEQLKDQNEQFLEQSEQVKSISEEVQSLEGQLVIAESRIINDSLDIEAKDQEIMEQKEQIQKRDDQITNKENEISSLTNQMQNKDHALKNMTEIIQSLKSHLVDAETQIKEKYDLINLKEKDLKKLGEELRSHNEQFRKQNEQLKEKSEQLKLKDELLDTKNSEIGIQREQIKNNENKISSLNIQIESITGELSNKTHQLLVCSAVEQCPKGRPNGIYSIKLPGDQVFEAPCNSSGWMTIQKRFDGSENFNRSWISYREGFGNIRGEFFIGLEKLHQLTTAHPHELLIRLVDKSGGRTYAHYDDFKIGSENESYYLKSLGTFFGTTIDGLKEHLDMKFSTYDRDNDLVTSNCAQFLAGGWWYKKCGTSTLNGKYYASGGYVHDGIFWPIYQGGKWINNISYTFVEIMIKQKNY